MPRVPLVLAALVFVSSACSSAEETCVDDDCTAQPGDMGPNGTGTTGANGGTTPGTQTSAATSPVGEWVYSSSSYPRDNGTTAVVSIGGDLSLRADGTWQHHRRIGGINASGHGRYTVAGSRLTLKHDDGSKDLVYDYVVGNHTDAQTGRTFKALTLSFIDGSGYRYLLVEKTN